ncbi:MAG TPA: hypothetical protein VD994_15405 [Prosthecobacter sp.]|nr:hypothetical protein [Prosthecobacter sp.]
MKWKITLTALAVCCIGSVGAQVPQAGPSAAAAEAEADIRLVLLPDAPRVDEATQQSVLAWVTRFQSMVYRMRVRDFIAAVDIEKLGTNLLVKTGSAPDAKEKATAARAFAWALEKMFPMLRDMFLFESAEIRRIDMKGAEAVVLARVRDQQGTELKVRWQLLREKEQWLMTDYELLTINARLSVVLALGAQVGARKNVVEGMQKIAGAQQEERFEDLVEIAEELEKEELAPMVREMLLLAKIGALSELGEFDQLTAEMDKLEAVAPDQPMLPYLRGNCAYWDEDYAATVKWLEKLGAVAGHDEESWSMLTEALMETDQQDKARLEAERWMADYPRSAQAIWTYWTSLRKDKDRAKRMRPHFERLVQDLEMAEEYHTLAEGDEEAWPAVWEVAKAKGIAPGSLKESEQAVKDAAEKLVKELQQAEAEKKPGQGARK